MDSFRAKSEQAEGKERLLGHGQPLHDSNVRENHIICGLRTAEVAFALPSRIARHLSAHLLSKTPHPAHFPPSILNQRTLRNLIAKSLLKTSST